MINTVKRVLETNKDYDDHFFPHPVQNAIVLLMTRGKIEGEPPFLKPHRSEDIRLLPYKKLSSCSLITFPDNLPGKLRSEIGL